MSRVDAVTAALRARGELWEPVPGAVGLGGAALALLETIEARIRRACLQEAAEEWRAPAALAWATLETADYFASFPQWLSAASHLDGGEAALEGVARSERPADAARTTLAPAPAALPPAVCYHVFAALAGRTLEAPRLLTAQGTCWRHEGERLRALERGWAFTMREVVCVGTPADVTAFRLRAEAGAAALAAELGIDGHFAEAADPFFLPTARGKALVQRMKGLKQEFCANVGDGRRIAAASSNDHENHFGRAFAIRLADGEPASSGCFAYGLERWLLALLAAHGTDPAGWPVHLNQEVMT